MDKNVTGKKGKERLERSKTEMETEGEKMEKSNKERRKNMKKNI
jgi:hypothetical protein